MIEVNFKRIVSVVIIAVVAIVLCSFLVRCSKVDSAEVGIKFNKLSLTEQGTLDATVVTGYTWYCPITTDLHTYPVYVQRKDYNPFTVTTRDAAIFTMDPTIAYQINRAMAIDIFQKYRKSLDEIEDGYMRTVIYDAYRITANKYTSDSLMANRAGFEGEVRGMLDKALSEEGFEVTEFTSQITPPETLRKAIDEKNKAIQESLKAENEVKKAEANAKIAVAKAEGEAQALKIKADGEAYYNRTVAASLNQILVDQYAIEKWDGHMPQITGSATPFVNLK
jgi:regulator of protease activity HflC (stomatin/prohibitin superfamily)